MNLASHMSGLKERGEKAFIAYLTCGDPNLEISYKIIETLAESGVDVIELGVPFSDPVGDGPTNQMAAERALQHGTSLEDVLSMVGLLRKRFQLPIVLFTYYNPIVKMGLAEFSKKAKISGVSGVLVVDLPPEEGEDYLDHLKQNGIDSVFLAAPTTKRERLKKIEEASSAFVYYVSRMGVTGAKSDISPSLKEEVAMVRAGVRQPVVVGFGISTPEQAKQVSALADGVVVGSAIVKIIEELGYSDALLPTLKNYVSSMVRAIKE